MSEQIHPSLLQRKIIHFDMDAFYAAIEMRDNPSLRAKPLVVGGSPKSRGVVCTASYEARKFGIHSAMSCAKAFKLCPQAIFVRPNFEKYKAASQQIRSVFHKYTHLVEPLSLDEAYLDVTDNSLGLYAIQIAKRIQQEVLELTGLTGSAGVAPNKMLAKIASDLRKPFGLSVILPEQVLAFVEYLPLRRIHGIGPATEKRLLSEGFKICRDLWAYSEEELIDRLGKNLGKWLYKRCRGIDERPVEIERVRKSFGREETFSVDLLDEALIDEQIHLIVADLTESMAKRNLQGRTVTLKVKYHDFEQVTRCSTVSEDLALPEEILAVTRQLMKKTEIGKKPVRLLGVSLSKLSEKPQDISSPC